MIEHVSSSRRGGAPGSPTSSSPPTTPRVRDAVEAYGGVAVMTRADHRSGTDRLAEVAAALTCDIIVNVQGDEPLIDPAMIDGRAGAVRRSGRRDDARSAAGSPTPRSS